MFKFSWTRNCHWFCPSMSFHHFLAFAWNNWMFPFKFHWKISEVSLATSHASKGLRESRKFRAPPGHASQLRGSCSWGRGPCAEMGIQREFQIFTGDLVDKFRPFLKEDHWKLTGNLMGIHGIFGNLLTSPFSGPFRWPKGIPPSPPADRDHHGPSTGCGYSRSLQWSPSPVKKAAAERWKPGKRWKKIWRPSGQFNIAMENYPCVDSTMIIKRNTTSSMAMLDFQSVNGKLQTIRWRLLLWCDRCDDKIEKN